MKNKFSMSLTLAVMLAMIAATIAFADDLLTGDTIVPVVDTPTLNLGNVCTGTNISKTVLHAINATGHPGSGNNIYANGTGVSVTITGVNGVGLNAYGGGVIVLPGNWASLGNQTRSNPVSSIITFNAGSTPRSFSGTVNYQAIGARISGGLLTRTDSLTVTANVIYCDTTPPTLNLPENMTVEATSAMDTAILYSATATDTNPLNPAVNCSMPSGFTLPVDAGATINCYATDAAGNTASGSFFVKVVDTTPPTVTPPTDITAEAVDASGALVTYSGELASDAVDDVLTPTCSPASGSTFPLGLNTVTCSATDSHGNTGSSLFNVNVQDTTAPVLVLPAEITAEATGVSGAAVDFTVSASDTVEGALTPSCTANSGDTFPLGTTTVSCSVADSNGNSSNGSFKVIVSDTTAPSLSLPVDFSMEATGASGATATFSASASDVVDGSVTTSCTPSSGSTFPLGMTPVSCSATDATGNTATSAFNVTVVDTTPPALTVPADQQLEATGPNGAAATFSASATDTVDGSPVVECDATSGATFPLGTTTVNCSATDFTGNKSTGSFVIIIEDTTAPVITFVNRTATNGNGWNNGDVTVNWSCEDIVGVVSASVSQTVSTEGENQLAIGICTDTSGNTASDTQNGINIDKTAPTASASHTPNANAFGWNNTNVTVSFSGTDALSGIASCSTDQVFGEGASQSASGTCTDMAGNISDAATVNNINVDKTAPTISGAPDHAANGNGWYNADVTVSFTCSDALSGVDDCTAPVKLGEGKDQNVPGTVTDKAGNSANTSVNGINIDKTDPVITASLDKTAVNGWFNISTGTPTVSFACSEALSGLDGVCPASHLFGDGEDQLYNQTIFDLAGNSASAGVNNVDVDTVAPSISASVSPARPASGWWNIGSGAPTVSFTCSDATSGVVTCPAANTFGEGENQAYSDTVFDHAGNSASASVSDIDVDITAPAVTVTPARSTDYNGWYNEPVSFSFTATDATSEVNACDAEVTYNGPDSTAANVSGSCTDKAGNSNSAGVTFKYDNTDPSISSSLSPALPANGWWNLSTGAPTASFTCSDDTAGIESCEGSHLFSNGKNQSLTGFVKDQAGNTNSTTLNHINVDLIAPVISAALDRSPAASGWFNASTGAPTVEFTCSDSGSSDLAYCSPAYTFGEGAYQSREGIAYDHAGNGASTSVHNVDVDTIAPSIVASLSPASPASSGWYNEVTGAPTVSFACSDATSGVIACPANYTFPEGANQARSQTIFDNAGNSSSTGVNDIDVDLTDPTITWTGGPADGASYYFGSVPADPVISMTDALSGPHMYYYEGSDNSVGTHTIKVTAYDKAGNSRMESRTYTVLAWTLKGFYQPVDMNGVFNVVKNGSTVPLKFEIFAGTTELVDVSAVDTLTYTQVVCNATLPQDEIETLATGSTVLRYDTTSGQFIFNWKTPSGTAGKCFRVTMKADDGSSLVAFFKLK